MLANGPVEIRPVWNGQSIHHITEHHTLIGSGRVVFFKDIYCFGNLTSWAKNTGLALVQPALHIAKCSSDLCNST